MLGNILSVSSQVFILFELMAVGYISERIGIITRKGAKQLTNLLLIIVTPCVIINSFGMTHFSQEKLSALLKGSLATFGVHIIAAVIGYFIYKPFKNKDIRVMKFCTIFSNCGFMALPLIETVIGKEGLFYGIVYITVFNLMLWTQGVFLITGEFNLKTIKKSLINPGTIGIIIGLPLFLFSIKLPNIISVPIGLVSSLNTPLAMIVLGSFISRANLKEAIRDKSVYFVAFAKLILVPGVMLIIFKLFNLSGILLTVLIIQTACPTATNAALFPEFYGGDGEYASKIITISTIFSIITIPLFIILTG